MFDLFTTPDKVTYDETQNRKTQPIHEQLRGGLFNMGNSVGNMGQRGVFDTDTRSPAQKRAIDLQNIAKGIDFKNPESMMQGANALNEAGYQAEAFKILSLIPKPSDKLTAIGDPVLQTITGKDGKQQQQYMQRYSDGSWKAVGSDLESQDAAPEKTGADNFKSGGQFDYGNSALTIHEQQVPLIKSILKSSPEFKESMFGNVELTDEDLAALTGVVFQQANETYRAMHNKITEGFRSHANVNNIDPQQMQILQANLTNALDLQMPSVAEHVRHTMQALKQSGQLDRFVKSGVASDDLDMNATVPSGEETLQKAQENVDTNTLQNKFNKDAGQVVERGSVDQMGGHLGVQGDPSTNEFRVDKLTHQQAGPLFGNMAKMSNRDAAGQLMGMGYKLSPELYDAHASRWEYMRENPDAANIYFYGTPNGSQGGLASVVDDKQRSARITTYLNDLSESKNQQKYLTSLRIFAYLRRIENGKQPIQREGYSGGIKEHGE